MIYAQCLQVIMDILGIQFIQTRFGNLEFAPHTTDPGTVHYPLFEVPKIFRNVYKPNEEYLKIAN